MGSRRLIAITHVCRTWRQTFTSRSSLWISLDCKHANKTRVYLERSKSSLIDVSLKRDGDLSPSDPFFQIVPHAIGRLKSLSIKGTRENLQDITSHLSLPAPLLEDLSIDGGDFPQRYNPVLTTELFNGDLSPLYKLSLRHVRTELPWRNMVNLTSFRLAHTSPGEVSATHLLDFFESAPSLRQVELRASAPTSGAQHGRLVSLDCLERMYVLEGGPSPFLLDHLLIPAGAWLMTQVDLFGPFPRCLDKNLSNSTKICLTIHEWYPRVRFSGPNGRIDMVLGTVQLSTTDLMLKSLAQFDTSKVKRLEINDACPSSRDLPYQTLLPMTALRTLTLHHCQSPHLFINALHPSMSSNVVACPKLEELILVLRTHETLEIKDVMEMAAARASRGAKFRSVRIVGSNEVIQIDSLELKKHVLHVECGPDVGIPYYDGGDES